MPTACLLQPRLHCSLQGERLIIRAAKEENEEETVFIHAIPLHDLERVIASDTTHFTTPALAALLSRGIPIQLFSWAGTFLGSFLPAHNHHGHARLAQYQLTLDPARCLALAQKILHAKLYNQRRVLQRLHHSRLRHHSDHSPHLIPEALAWLDGIFPYLRNSCTIDQVRGYEGASTARYFATWATLLPKQFPFERRSSRPPLNPVNSVISFASTILSNEMTAFLHAHGLDPALGVLHQTENGRWSLALDLIEPFRPAFVEALTLDLFSHAILNHSDFSQRQGGIYLDESGRRKFFYHYEKRMERQFLSEALGHRTTLRQQLENQALLYKAQLPLSTHETFSPFLIN
jgi:CRISPR-associated protein Cas1